MSGFPQTWRKLCVWRHKLSLYFTFKYKVKFVAISLSHIAQPLSPCLHSLLSYLSSQAPSSADGTCCWFKEALEKISRSGRSGFPSAGSWWAMDVIHSRSQYFTESKPALPPCPFRVSLCCAFRPCHTYRSCRNRFLCHVWKIPLWICVRWFPESFPGDREDDRNESYRKQGQSSIHSQEICKSKVE